MRPKLRTTDLYAKEYSDDGIRRDDRKRPPMSLGTNHQTLAHITVVTAPGCHFCEDAQAALAELAAGGAGFDFELVEATSPAGLALLAQHRPPMNPLVLVDGGYFSAGRLPRRKLNTLLATRGVRPDSMVARNG
jgi:hypothetical protein